jgi:hypothetical protein
MPALLIIGVLIILGGLALLVVWIEFLWDLIKAVLPLGIIGVGGIMAYFGWEEKKESRGSYLDFSSPTEASRYQAEALAYQEKLNGFQDESLALSPTEELSIVESQDTGGDEVAPSVPPYPFSLSKDSPPTQGDQDREDKGPDNREGEQAPDQPIAFEASDPSAQGESPAPENSQEAESKPEGGEDPERRGEE